MNQLSHAIQFLTILPVRTRDVAGHEYAKIMRWFPLAGLLIGLVTAALYVIFRQVLPVPAALLISLFFQIFITGGLHIDGFADTCDGCMSGRNRERMLEIMKDSCLGTHGTIAVVGVILIKITLLVTMPVALHLVVLTLTPVMGRFALVFASWRSEYARSKGLGHLFIGRITTRDMAISLMMTILFSLMYPPATAILPVVMIMIVLLNKKFVQLLGGITGDTLGACNELAEVLFLTVVLSLHNWS